MGEIQGVLGDFQAGPELQLSGHGRYRDIGDVRVQKTSKPVREPQDGSHRAGSSPCQQLYGDSRQKLQKPLLCQVQTSCYCSQEHNTA